MVSKTKSAGKKKLKLKKETLQDLDPRKKVKGGFGIIRGGPIRRASAQFATCANPGGPGGGTTVLPPPGLATVGCIG